MNLITQQALRAYEKTEHIEIDVPCENCGYNKEEHGPLSDMCPNYIGDLKLGYKEHSSYKEKVDCLLNKVCV